MSSSWKQKRTYKIRVFHGKLHTWCLRSYGKCVANRMQLSNAVIVTAFSGKKYGDNPRYISEKIHELLPDTKIIWFCNDSIGHIPPYVRIVSFSNAMGLMRELASASIIIDNDLSFAGLIVRDDQFRIQTWHGGLGIKKIGVDAASPKTIIARRSRQAYDFFISNSNFLTNVYRTAFRYDGPVWKCGYPIEDELQNDNNEKQLYRKQYKIPEDTKIVLYAPTFRTEYRWQSKLIVGPVIDALGKRFGGKWVMLVHWHPNNCLEDRVLPGAIEAADADSMQSLVKAADAFISDYSSSIFQAVQCHIPCFVYADDYEEYNLDRGMYLPFDEQPFPFARTEQELLDNIAGYDSAVWNEKWQQYRIRTGHVVTGHSAEDIAKVCVDFLNGKPKSEIMKEIPFETEY